MILLLLNILHAAHAAAAGKNVTIYMLDSGIKTSHQEFQPWSAAGSSSSRALSGPDFVDDDDDAGGTQLHSQMVVGIYAMARLVVLAKCHFVVLSQHWQSGQHWQGGQH
jgi:subtilisin family serine protease